MYIVYDSSNKVVLMAARKEDVKAYEQPDLNGASYRIEEVTSEAINDKILNECTGS